MRRGLVVVTLLIAAGCQSQPDAATGGTPSPAVVASASASATSFTPTSSATASATAAIPSASPCAEHITPLVDALVRQNGNLDLGPRFALGSVRFFLAGCREIETVRAKYGLGLASLVITQPGPGDIATRYYRAQVPVGEEAAYVTRLAAHPEDFQYVEFDVIAHVCVLGSGPGPAAADCWVNSTVSPREGPAGTSFTMTMCCWPAGTHVTKTFTTPSGETIVINDVAGANETVPAGWGGSNTDERGTYTLFVRDGEESTFDGRTLPGLASMIRFTID